MVKRALLVGLVVVAAVAAARTAGACTNILVTKGASTDGSSFLTYSADSHEFYGELVLIPGGSFQPGAVRDVIEWDSGKFLGRIPQVAKTYWVVGNMNEHQVAVGETTFTGREELAGPAGILDYGSLMFIGLERAKTAREAVKVVTDLVAEYGYASTGESISFTDPNEAWLLEIIGKGKDAKGAVWVAQRIPDGAISAHANQARIRRFPLNDQANCLYAKDVISFARDKGWFKGKDDEFSFADTYAPVDFGALRFCEARVWNVFRRVAPSLGLTPDYVDGSTATKRLPVWVKPDKKLSVADVMALMRDHFEDTPFDLSKGLGAGPFACPYRWRPMQWEVDGAKYVHERAISTQQTGFSFVAQSRAGLPDPIGGVFWFGVDDTDSTVYVPFYCGIRSAPRSWAAGTARFSEFSWDSAFWVFNFVANWTYSRYSDMIVDVRKVQRELEGQFLGDQAAVEEAAKKLHDQAPQLARDYLTAYCAEQGEMVTARWRKLGEFLLWKYLDGNVRDAQGHVTHPEYPADWYRAIARVEGPGKREVTPDAPAPTPAPNP